MKGTCCLFKFSGLFPLSTSLQLSTYFYTCMSKNSSVFIKTPKASLLPPYMTLVRENLIFSFFTRTFKVICTGAFLFFIFHPYFHEHLYGCISTFLISPVSSWPSVRVHFHFSNFTRIFMAICTGAFPLFRFRPYFHRFTYRRMSLFCISPISSAMFTQITFQLFTDCSWQFKSVLCRDHCNELIDDSRSCNGSLYNLCKLRSR